MLPRLGRVQTRWFAIGALLIGCRDVRADKGAPTPTSKPHVEQANAATAGDRAVHDRAVHDRAVGDATVRVAATNDVELEAFRRIFRLSEAGEAFISDNVISNETSLLEPAAALARLQGGVYLGVGPEQNYTYIALSRPEYAILVDLRRDNALLHLLYKSLFEQAASRLEFLSLLFGRPYVKQLEPPPNASIDVLLTALVRSLPSGAWYDLQHQRLLERLQRYNLELSPQDTERIGRLHQLFFERQLELRFELRDSRVRSYPSLGQLLRLRSPGGIGTFLDSSASYEFVRSLQRRHRIVPLVGDVSTERPLQPIADELRQRGLLFRTFYISNVEQYLVGQPSYRGWIGTLQRLPHDENSVILRCYLDQGRRHPRQRPGSRTTTLAQNWNAFLERSAKRPHPSFYAIVTDEALDAKLSE